MRSEDVTSLLTAIRTLTRVVPGGAEEVEEPVVGGREPEVADRTQEPTQPASLRVWSGRHVVLASVQDGGRSEAAWRRHGVDPSGQVDGMVPESLVVAGDRARGRRQPGVGALGHTFVDQAGGEVVELVVGIAQSEPCVAGALSVCGAGDLPHVHGDVAHRLDQAATSRRDQPADVTDGPLGDVLGEVGAPLQLRDHLEHRDEVFELVGTQVRGREALLHRRGESLAALVDFLVVGDDLVGPFDVLVEQRGRGPTHALGDECEQDEHRVVDAESELFGFSSPHGHLRHAIRSHV